MRFLHCPRCALKINFSLFHSQLASIKTPARARAARLNGRLGGRPKSKKNKAKKLNLNKKEKVIDKTQPPGIIDPITE